MFIKPHRLVLLAICANLTVACDPNDEPERAEDESDAEDEDVTPRASCSGNGCNGLPVSSECAYGSYPVKKVDIKRSGTSTIIGYVQIFWSPVCSTNWSRVTRTDGFYAEGMNAIIYRSDGEQFPKGTGYAEGKTVHQSTMVWAPSPYKARAWGAIDQSVYYGSSYTPWY